MKRTVILAGLSAVTLLTTACGSTTTREDVRAARDRVDDSYAYGDRVDQQDAKRDMRHTLRDYREDNRCGPEYGRPC